MIPAIVVDRPTPFERLSFLPSLSFSLSLSLSLFLSQEFFCEYYYEDYKRWRCGGGGGVISIHFFFVFFQRHKTLRNKNKKKKKGEKKTRSIYFHNSCVRSRTLLPHRDRHAVRSAPTVRDYRRRHHCHWWHPICRARFTHG